MKRNKKVNVEVNVEKNGNKARVNANIYIKKECVMSKFGKIIGRKGCCILIAIEVVVVAIIACILSAGLIIYSAALYPFKKYIGYPEYTPAQVIKDAMRIPQETKEIWEEEKAKC